MCIGKYLTKENVTTYRRALSHKERSLFIGPDYDMDLEVIPEKLSNLKDGSNQVCFYILWDTKQILL